MGQCINGIVYHIEKKKQVDRYMQCFGHYSLIYILCRKDDGSCRIALG